MGKTFQLIIGLWAMGILISCSQNPLPDPKKGQKRFFDFLSQPDRCSEETVQDYHSVEWLLEQRNSLFHDWDLFTNQKALAKACQRLRLSFQTEVSCQNGAEELHMGPFKSFCSEAQKFASAPICQPDYVSLRNLIKTQSDRLQALAFANRDGHYSDEMRRLATKLDGNCEQFFKTGLGQSICLNENPSQRTDLFEIMTRHFVHSCDLARKISRY